MTCQNVTRVEHAGSWRVRTAGSLQDKKYSLAFLLFDDWNSRLIPVASDLPVHPLLLKTNFSHFISCPTINTLILTKCRELPERILRKKPQRTTRLIHPQFYTFDSPNSSTLTLSIVIPMRGSMDWNKHLENGMIGLQIISWIEDLKEGMPTELCLWRKMRTIFL